MFLNQNSLNGPSVIRASYRIAMRTLVPRAGQSIVEAFDLSRLTDPDPQNRVTTRSFLGQQELQVCLAPWVAGGGSGIWTSISAGASVLACGPIFQAFNSARRFNDNSTRHEFFRLVSVPPSLANFAPPSDHTTPHGGFFAALFGGGGNKNLPRGAPPKKTPLFPVSPFFSTLLLFSEVRFRAGRSSSSFFRSSVNDVGCSASIDSGYDQHALPNRSLVFFFGEQLFLVRRVFSANQKPWGGGFSSRESLVTTFGDAHLHHDRTSTKIADHVGPTYRVGRIRVPPSTSVRRVCVVPHRILLLFNKRTENRFCP